MEASQTAARTLEVTELDQVWLNTGKSGRFFLVEVGQHTSRKSIRRMGRRLQKRWASDSETEWTGFDEVKYFSLKNSELKKPIQWSELDYDVKKALTNLEEFQEIPFGLILDF